MPANDYSWMYMAVGLIIVALVMIGFRLIKSKRAKMRSFYDVLTGGRTETAYLTGVRKTLEGKSASYALVSMQIRNLPHVFRAFGAEEGEKTLKHIHSVLETQLSSEELMARTGEDAFGFILKNRKPEEISARLERIHAAINQYNKGKKDIYELDMCFGIYLPEEGERDVITMQGRSVQARMSTPAGRRYQFYDRASWDKNAWEREMAKNIDYALQTSEFVVFYQPKVRVLDQRVVGLEALVRWRHPQRGLLSPDMFLTVAEHFQKVSKIDRFVFEDVCRTLARWKKQGRELCPISVNLSRADIADSNLADECAAVCEKYGVEPAQIEFEIREKLLLENLETVSSLIERIHANGFRCAVDNFGADAVSMQILSTLDVDTVKLDRSFFSGDNDNRRGRYIVEAIIKLATQLQISTVAQGVDNPGQVKYLQRVACDMIQGFYYFKPMALEQLESAIFDGSNLRYADVREEQPVQQGEKKRIVHSDGSEGNKNLVFFSYLPEEDTVEFSEAFSPIFGRRRKFNDALALFRTTELIHENDRDDFFKLLERCQREDGWVENTLRFCLAEGRYGWLELHMRRDGYDSGSVISGTLINMSE
ncbi:MAG: EAL domain-containing protein [Clostridia bacterium]|nr:EAL domain-containing protein [Clostridia bacterium]